MRNKILKAIKKQIEASTNRCKANMLGPKYVNKAFFFTLDAFDPKTTLAYSYLHGHTLHSVDPTAIDKQAIKTLENVALTYVDKMEQTYLTDMSSIINSTFDQIEQESKIKRVDIQEVMDSSLGKGLIREMQDLIEYKIDKMQSKVDQIVTTEIGNAQNYGVLDGILGASKNLGISDPVIMKLGILDDRTCLVKGEKILMKNGSLKNIEDLKLGDVIRNHKTMSIGSKINSCNSTVLYKNIIKKDCILVTFSNGRTLKCSKDHPVLLKHRAKYIFWEIGNIPENMWDEIDIVDHFSFSKKSTNKVSYSMNTSLNKSAGYIDMWEFIKGERDIIKKLYIDQKKTVLQIAEDYYGVDGKLSVYISSILLLMGVILDKQILRCKTGTLNKRHIQDVSARVAKHLDDNKNEIVNDFVTGLGYRELCKKYKVSCSLIERFLKNEISPSRYMQCIASKKAKAGRIRHISIKKDPIKYKEYIDRARISFLNSKHSGSKPQKALFDLLIKSGYSGKYNCSIEDKIRVDMIIDDQIVIEFDGSGHNMMVRRGFMTQKQLNARDYGRDVLCKKCGFKVLRISSLKDKIPNIESLIDNIDLLKKSNHTFLKMEL